MAPIFVDLQISCISAIFTFRDNISCSCLYVNWKHSCPRRLHELKIYERIVNRVSDVGVANLATRRRSRLGSPERGAGSLNGLTEGFSCSVYGQTPPPHVRSAPPLPGEAWALRASNSDTYYIIYKLFTHAIVVILADLRREAPLVCWKRRWEALHAAYFL